MDKICETHGRLRCSECAYVIELEERVNTLNKVIDELKLDEERLTDKYKSKDGENYLLRQRVRELERDRAEWEIEAHTQNARNKRLLQENKRYKQDINEIHFQASLVETSDNVYNAIIQALEGEE